MKKGKHGEQKCDGEGLGLRKMKRNPSRGEHKGSCQYVARSQAVQ